MSTDLVIARLDAARLALSEARTIQDTKKILDVAAAAEIYARRQKLSDENIAFANEVKIEALRQLGEFLKESPKNPGVLLRGSEKEPREHVRTLAEQGVDKKTSMVAQRLAALPADKYEEVKKGHMSLAKATATPKSAPTAAMMDRPGDLKPATPEGADMTEDELAAEALGDPAAVMEDMDAQIRQLTHTVEILTRDDEKAELAKQIALAKDAERRLGEQMNVNALDRKAMDGLAKFQGDVFRLTSTANRADALRVIRSWKPA